MLEYKTEVVDVYDIFRVNFGVGNYGYDEAASKKKANLEKVLNENAAEGWRLKATQSSNSSNSCIILIFEREITEGEITL